MTDPAQFKDRDIIARAFADLYRSQQQEFPPECHDIEYEKRLRAAYPIHPEVFDRLYSDWSTLIKFQRTRGVLRLMAAVIYCLWEKGDKNALIMPANIPIEDQRVQFELTRYLSDNWIPIIEKDVDGPNSLPLRIDAEVPNLGKFAASRRVARTIYLGSAPNPSAANRGIEDRRVKLGCVVPGESPAVFGDALRRLASSATYLYQDGPRYWYSTQPTVTKLADDRAEQFKRDPEKVERELDKRLRNDLRKTGDFDRVHPLPASSGDVPESLEARLVVLGINQAYSKESGNPAETFAKKILETRGSNSRIYRNTLVFLAADKTRLQDLDEAIRKYLAWESILAEHDILDLTPHQVKQAQTQKEMVDRTVTAQIPETYQWLLVPTQQTPKSPMEMLLIRLNGQDELAVRASKKLKSEELLVTALAGTRLRMELDKIPLWRGENVPIKQLEEDFASYIYLPKLKNTTVLKNAICDGLRLLTWDVDSFAYADSFDDATHRYRGLRGGQSVSIQEGDSGLLVRSDIALGQIEIKPVRLEITPARLKVNPGNQIPYSLQAFEKGGYSKKLSKAKWSAQGGTITDEGLFIAGQKEGEFVVTAEIEDLEAKVEVEIIEGVVSTSGNSLPKRFHASVTLDSARVGRDASKIADEVISHLAGLVNSNVKVTLEIEAEIPDGVPDNVVRTVTENSKTLKFTNQGFEKE